MMRRFEALTRNQMVRRSSVPPTRADRPHVYLAQEPDLCPRCGAGVERRTVLETGKAVHLVHCAKCGPQEVRDARPLAPQVEAAFGRRRSTPEQGLLKRTTSTCPTCLALVEARVVVAGDRVFFEKECASCGPSRALVSEDARFYLDAYAFSRAGSQPLRRFARPKDGCPRDCGLCGDHEQHTCVPIVEVTDHCNLTCPACLVDNANARHLDPQAFAGIVDNLVACEGQLESIALSGGEPTSHPRILDLVDIATRPEVGRVVLLTNGMRIGRDRAFAQALREKGVYVSLQLDGFALETHQKLRGKDLRAEKEAALRALEDLRIPTQIIFVVARGVNEGEIGSAVDLLLTKDHVLSLLVQPFAYAGAGGGRFQVDPLDRITIPGVLRAIGEQSRGVVRGEDFYPLPCPSPHCVALTFLLKLADGRMVPFARFVDLAKHGALLRNSATLPALPEIEEVLRDVVYDVFARQDEMPDGPSILAALSRALRDMFPPRPLAFREAVKLGERHAKSIFVHHYMDPYDFDLERVRKCCHHYPQTDSRLMPACSFNLFHRGAAKGKGTPRAAWGRAPREGA